MSKIDVILIVFVVVSIAFVSHTIFNQITHINDMLIDLHEAAI